jgi:hypothetical protein
LLLISNKHGTDWTWIRESVLAAWSRYRQEGSQCRGLLRSFRVMLGQVCSHW